MKVLLHGGAGGTPAAPEARQAVLDEAAATGAAAETPLAAVEAALRVLETSPRFNAGVGSAVQSDGAIRTDAGAMTGDRRIGAACSLRDVEHAVTIARAVLEETPHVLLAGDPAREFARTVGVDVEADLWTADRREGFAEAAPPAAYADQLAWVRERYDLADDGGDGTAGDGTGHDTVGGVAVDGDRVAAATSTGGRRFALAGRVGDVPQAGSGFFATPAGGASATGDGEDIVRATLCRDAVDRLAAGAPADEAAPAALESFVDLTGGTAGLVVLDADGGVGSAFNSAAMQTATATR